MATITIFRTGRHVASSGQSIEFSAADMEACVKSYDPKLHEAPIVVGHPRADAPAYGWIDSLSFADGQLSAEPHQVDAEFQELVKQGRFKKVSASFYLPDSPQNPVPGTYYLRHVGFLGAQPPAVKGLKAASFGEADAGVIEFGDWGDTAASKLFYGLREFLIDKFGMEDADKALPGYLLDSLDDFARKPEDEAEPEPSYSEPKPEPAPEPSAEFVEAKAQLDARAAELAAKEAELATQAAAARRREMVAFCEDLTKSGRVPPNQAPALVEFMMQLGEGNAVEFAEGKAETPLSWLKGFLQALPKQVEFSEQLKPEPAAQPTTIVFAPAPGFTASADKLEAHAKAKAYQEAHPGTDFIQAVKAVGNDL